MLQRDVNTYFELLLSHILCVRTQVFKYKRNDITAAEIIGSQSCEKRLLSFAPDLCNAIKLH